jgi:hypothetical protein
MGSLEAPVATQKQAWLPVEREGVVEEGHGGGFVAGSSFGGASGSAAGADSAAADGGMYTLMAGLGRPAPRLCHLA